MKLLNPLAFPLFLILFFKPCLAVSQNQYMITDLDSLDSTGFTNQASSWIYKGASCPSCIFTMPSDASCDSTQEGQMVYGGPYAPISITSDYFLIDFSASATAWSKIGMEFDVWVFATSEIPNFASLLASKFIALRTKNHYFSSSKMILLGSCSTDFVSAQGSQIKYIYRFHTQYIHSPVIPYPNPTSFGFLKRTGSSALPSVDSIGIRNLKLYNLGSSTSSLVSLSFPCTEGNFWNVNSCQACPTGCLACSGSNQGQCTSCKSSYYDDGNGVCRTSCSPPFQQIPGTMKCANQCSPGFYWARNESCIETCEAPLVQSLDGNGGPLCSSPCSDSTQFVYPDKSCSLTCDPLLKDRTEATIKLCLNPCQTAGTGTSSFFLYPDGACVDTCSTPLSQKTEKGVTYCYSTCSSVTHFIYPDQSCSLTCDRPLTSNTEHGISSCSSACSGLIERLYPDGSCKACPTPFSQKTGNTIQYCENPCIYNKTFLYEDGTCKEACNSPSIAKDDPSIGKTCKFPCPNIDHYYNNQNGKCIKTCGYTSEAIESPLPKICFSALSEEEVKEVQAVADTANNANSASNTGSMIWSIISSSDSTAACLGPLSKMLQYIKFMDIRFPEKVLILMEAQSKSSEGFSAKMMKDVLEEFPSHELPRKFKVYQSSSSFFVNFWPAFFNLSMVLLVTGLVVFGTEKTKGHPKINGILKSLTGILKWNVFLITFSGNIGDIVLYTSMEFQTVEFSNFASVLSFLSCLGINTLAVMVVMKILDINSSIRKSKKETKDEEKHKKMIEQEWGSYKALFECYKEYSFYQQIFLFVFLVRLALFNAMIGYLYNYPLLQAVVVVVLNILMLGYLVIKRPMKKVVSLIQQIVLELVLLPFNICVLALAIMDNREIVNMDHRKSIGEVIVYINIMVPILSLVLMAAKVIAMGVDFYKSWKLAKANKIKKLASVKSGFRSTDLLNKSEEKFPVQNLSMESSCLNKNSTQYNVQIVDLTDQSMMISTEHHSVQSNFPNGNERIRSSFMENHYDHQNSIAIATSQNFILPEYQNSFQQQSQFALGIVQGEMAGQHFQNEMMPSPNHRRKINKKRRDHLTIQDHA